MVKIASLLNVVPQKLETKPTSFVSFLGTKPQRLAETKSATSTPFYARTFSTCNIILSKRGDGDDNWFRWKRHVEKEKKDSFEDKNKDHNSNNVYAFVVDSFKNLIDPLRKGRRQLTDKSPSTGKWPMGSLPFKTKKRQKGPRVPLQADGNLGHSLFFPDNQLRGIDGIKVLKRKDFLQVGFGL